MEQDNHKKVNEKNKTGFQRGCQRQTCMSKEADVSYYRSLSQNLHQGPEQNRRNANTQQQESVKHHDDNDDDDDKGAYVEK